MLALANLSQLCRICLRHLRQQQQQQQSPNATPARDTHYLQRNKSSYNSRALPHLAEMLNQFFAIDIFQQPDTFPQQICALCYNAMEYFQQLCTVAEQSNEMLRHLELTLIEQPEVPIPNTGSDAIAADADVDHSVGIYKSLQLSQLVLGLS